MSNTSQANRLWFSTGLEFLGRSCHIEVDLNVLSATDYVNGQSFSSHSTCFNPCVVSTLRFAEILSNASGELPAGHWTKVSEPDGTEDAKSQHLIH